MSGESRAAGGFYRMSRGWMENPVLMADRAPANRREAWVWLIENVAFAPYSKFIGPTRVMIQRGQVVASMRYLAKAWQWQEPKVRRFISALTEAKMIDAVSDAHATVITLCNYDKYQSVNQEADAPADAPPTHHRRTTDAKDKEENEDKEHNSESLATDAPESTGVVGLPAAKGRKPRTKAHATKGATGDLIMAFERWWSEYPTERRIKKPKALAAYMKARATVDENTLLNSLRMFQFDRREFGRWIPEPLNWLGDERWLDGQRGEQSNLVSGRADWVARRQARVAEGDLILDGIVEEVL